jgi:hypothetical protein
MGKGSHYSFDLLMGLKIDKTNEFNNGVHVGKGTERK